MMTLQEIQMAEKCGLGKVVETLQVAMILHSGWASDNKGWVVRLDTGKVVGITTNHGRMVPWAQNEMQEKLVEARASSNELRLAITALAKGKFK